MFQAEITYQMAEQHIADLRTEATQARLAASVRRPRRGIRGLLHVRTRPAAVTARTAC